MKNLIEELKNIQPTGIPMSVKLVSSLGFYFVEKLPHIIALLEAGEKMKSDLVAIRAVCAAENMVCTIGDKSLAAYEAAAKEVES